MFVHRHCFCTGVSFTVKQHKPTVPLGALLVKTMFPLLAVVILPQVDSGATWQENGAGLSHSYEHGFGLMTAWRLVQSAKVGLSPVMYGVS